MGFSLHVFRRRFLLRELQNIFVRLVESDDENCALDKTISSINSGKLAMLPNLCLFTFVVSCMSRCNLRSAIKRRDLGYAILQSGSCCYVIQLTLKQEEDFRISTKNPFEAAMSFRMSFWVSCSSRNALVRSKSHFVCKYFLICCITLNS